jgi:hypothetical protein
MIRRVTSTWVFVVAGVWLIAVSAGLRVLWGYSTKPGPAMSVAAAGRVWPQGTSLSRDGQLHTLVMFVHPKCPCSRASAGELSRIMSRCAGKVRVQVVAVLPQGASQDWGDSVLIKRLRGIPGVELCIDHDGREAERFGARTSGQSNLYDPAGRLLFSGGITAARGHEGDNAGADSIVSLVSGSDAALQSTTPVFGCSLQTCRTEAIAAK